MTITETDTGNPSIVNDANKSVQVLDDDEDPAVLYEDHQQQHHQHAIDNKGPDYEHSISTDLDAPGPDAETAVKVKNSNRIARRTGVTAEAAPYDISYHPGRVLLYSPIRQRQKWGDTQVLPRVNWGDLFFDLFYVAATYNVSYILVNDTTTTGILYAAGTFLPVMGVWQNKMYFDARFVHEDDLYHRLYSLAVLVVLATAVLHIRPVNYLSQPDAFISMFVLSLCLVIERVLAVTRSVEIYWFGLGQTSVLRQVAIRDIRSMVLSGSFYLAAAIVSGLEYYGNSNNSGSGSGARALAAAETTAYGTTEPTNIPIILVLVGFVGNYVLFSLFVIFCFPGGGRHKDTNVPMNVDFALHRNGEWIMLMLGESIFSLLIVDVPNETTEFHITFYLSLLTVILLQYLHFRSQPSHADEHAMRRSKNAGMLWSNFQMVYSLVLVMLGASFTIFLTVFGSEGSSEEPLSCRRWLAEAAVTGDEDPACRRWLAGGGDDSEDPDAIKQQAAHLFSGSLALIFFCLDCMTMLHLGWDESKDRCVLKETSAFNMIGFVLLSLRAAVLVFVATLSQWETEPDRLAFIGVMCVLLQLLLRKLGAMYLSHGQFAKRCHAFECKAKGEAH